MWSKEMMLAFIEQSGLSVKRLMDELEKNGIEKIDGFELESTVDPIGIKITVFKDDKHTTAYFSEAEKKEALRRCQAYGK